MTTSGNAAQGAGRNPKGWLPAAAKGKLGPGKFPLRRREPVPGSLADVAPSLVTPTEHTLVEPDEPQPVDALKIANSQSNNSVQSAVPSTSVRHLSPFKWGFFGGLGVLLAYVTFLAIDSLQSTLIVIAIAALLAIGLDPAVGFLIRRGMRRGFAVLIVMASLLAFIGGALYAVIPPIVTEVSGFITNIPTLLTDLQENPAIKDLDAKFGIIEQIQNSSVLQDLAPGAADTVVTAAGTIAGVFLDLLIILILTLYFLAGFPRIKRSAYRLAPGTKRGRVTEIGDVILRQMGKYLAGATLIAIQAGLFAGVFATIIGLPYPWAIALGAALLDFIPVIGPILIGVSMMLLGFTVSVTVGIIAAAVYLCQHLVEAYWLYPKVMNRAMSISTGSVVVAILVGGALLGVTGALMAVPVAAAIQLIVREVVLPIQDQA